MFTKKEKWDVFFLKTAQLISSLSKDPSTKVGAVIVDDDKNIVATGYNGFPKGFPDTEEYLNNRELKYEYVEHAERNAIVQAAKNGAKLNNCTLYSTHFSCISCAKGVTNAGIKRFVYIHDKSFEERWDSEKVKNFYQIVKIPLEFYEKERLDEIAKHFNFACSN